MPKRRKPKKERKLRLDKLRQSGLKRDLEFVDKISKAASEIVKKGRSPGEFVIVNSAVAEALSKC